MPDHAQTAAVERYASSQVVLHWTIAALVGVQWLSSGAMEAFFQDNDNGPPGFPPLPAQSSMPARARSSCS